MLPLSVAATHCHCCKGPLSTDLMEPLLSLLDDNKKLCLPNGDTINLTSNVRIIFLMTPESAAAMSPACVSRLGRVNLQHQELVAPAATDNRKRKVLRCVALSVPPVSASGLLMYSIHAIHCALSHRVAAPLTALVWVGG